MNSAQVNRISSKVLLILSLIALVTVLTGYTVPRGTIEGDEGTAAHIFQLSIVALVPGFLVFAATTDWKRPRQDALSLVLPATILVFAFAALFCLEHYWLRRS